MLPVVRAALYRPDKAFAEFRSRRLPVPACCTAHFPLFFSPGTDQASAYRQSTNDFTAPSMPDTFGLFDSMT